jgi:hypothetical protein
LINAPRPLPAASPTTHRNVPTAGDGYHKSRIKNLSFPEATTTMHSKLLSIAQAAQDTQIGRSHRVALGLFPMVRHGPVSAGHPMFSITHGHLMAAPGELWFFRVFSAGVFVETTAQ